MARDEVAVYASGGFTTYDLGELRTQMADWAGDGFTKMKMKVCRDPRRLGQST